MITYYNQNGAIRRKTNRYSQYHQEIEVITFWSYDTIIAFYVKQTGTVYERTCKFSCSTSRHKNQLRHFAYPAYAKVDEVDRLSFYQLLKRYNVLKAANYPCTGCQDHSISFAPL